MGVQSVIETVRVCFNWNACSTLKKCRDYFSRMVTDDPVVVTKSSRFKRWLPPAGGRV